MTNANLYIHVYILYSQAKLSVANKDDPYVDVFTNISLCTLEVILKLILLIQGRHTNCGVNMNDVDGYI